MLAVLGTFAVLIVLFVITLVLVDRALRKSLPESSDKPMTEPPPKKRQPPRVLTEDSPEWEAYCRQQGIWYSPKRPEPPSSDPPDSPEPPEPPSLV